MSSSFLEASRPGQHRWWRFLLTLLAMGLAVMVFHIGLGIVAYTQGLIDLTTGTMAKAPVWYTTLSLLVFPLQGAALLLCVKLFHRRAPSSLLGAGGRLRWRPLVVTTVVTFGAMTGWTLLVALLEPETVRYTFEPARFLLYLVPVLLLVPMQAATEELVFRGWLMQEASSLVRRPWFAVGVNSALFMALHTGNYGGLTPTLALYYFGFGALLSLVTLVDGRLERAMGLHIGLNLCAFLVGWTEMPMLEPFPTLLTQDMAGAHSPIQLLCFPFFGLVLWLTRSVIHPAATPDQAPSSPSAQAAR